MTTEDDFRQALETDPTDRVTRLIFADWLALEGRDVEANGQRWQARNQQWPRWWAGTRTWDWWYLSPEELAHDWGRDWEVVFHADLPADVCNQLGSVVDEWFRPDGTGWRGWRTLRDAETALAQALAELEL